MFTKMKGKEVAGMLPLILMTIESEDDRAFLTSIYNEHYQLMCEKADSIVHNRHDAEDIAQDMLEYIIEHIEKFRKIGCCTLPFYLVMCIRRRSFNHLKKRAVQRKHTVGSIDHEQFAFDYPDPTDSVEEQALLQLKVEQVQEAFTLLPERMKDILRYKYLLEMSDSEIAETLGIKKNSVREYLTRARRAVYQICEEKGYVWQGR